MRKKKRIEIQRERERKGVLFLLDGGHNGIA